MAKRCFSVLVVVFMMLSSLASVVAEPTVTLAPQQAYETNHVSFSLNVSNFRNSYEVRHVQADLSQFSMIALADYKGWTETFDGSLADWTGGSIANNVVLSVFEFLASAPVVSQDTQTQATVKLYDSDNAEHTYTFPLTILNDATPPSLSDLIPVDAGFVKQGATSQKIQVNASDPETGIQNVTFHYVRCNYTQNITPADRTIQLAESNGLYSNSIDLSDYDNEQHVCFDFKAYNKGGDFSAYSGQLTVDGVPPQVTLVSPVDKDIIGLGKNFSFFASDNLAPMMDCRMFIDGAEYMKDIAAAHMDVVFIASADAEEGEHTWSMRCSDMAGWEGSSQTWTYTLDKTPPAILMTAPENNSIIADSTTLEFSVTDNNQLRWVWFSHDDNETKMDGVFSVDVASWPDGPNDFTVRAEDSVGNKAEQTYRVIIDRTPPQVTLVSPSDMATSDVHVNFTYNVVDNYDESLDCKVYIGGTGQEDQLAEGGELAAYSKLLAVGEYRWNVQCVDDAGNSGSSDEFGLSVVDMTGPDITVNSPEVVYRGDPVTVSLDVTDISGVETVTARFRDPNGNTQDIPLEKLADSYTAQVGTLETSPLGTYTIEVYAVDTLNNSNDAVKDVLVTYKYVVTLDLPASVVPGATVSIGGQVLYDNGSLVPETAIELLLPGNVTQTVGLVEGRFSYSFTAPSDVGTYDVTASLTSSGNGQIFSRTKQLQVASPVGGGGGGGHGGGISSSNDDDEGCSQDWECTAWTMCSGGKQEKTCVDLNHCSTEKKKESRNCVESQKTLTEEKEDEDDTASEGNAVSATASGIQAPEQYEVDAAAQDESDAAGIGKASGFMTFGSVSAANILFALLLVALLLGVMLKFGWGKVSKKRPVAQDILATRGRHNMNLEEYLQGRASRK